MCVQTVYNQYVEAGYTKDFLNWFIECGCNLPTFKETEESDEE